MDHSTGAADLQVGDASDLTANIQRGAAAQSLLAPLLPATPPRARNARLVTFDDEHMSERSDEAAKPTAMRLPNTRADLSRRERAARRAARRVSLFSAAGF